jgi:hypothetical protein
VINVYTSIRFTVPMGLMVWLSLIGEYPSAVLPNLRHP